MNRREFTRGLASLGLTPALPLPAMGAGATATAAASTIVDKLYFVGWYTARMNKTCSPEVLVSELKVDGDTARKIFSKLVKNGTVSAPDAFGVSRTIDPLRSNYRRLARNTAKRAVAQTSKPTGQDALKTAKQAIRENEPDIVEESRDAVEDQQDTDGEIETDAKITEPTDTPQTRSVAEK